MNRKQKRTLVRVIISGVIFFALLVPEKLGLLESLPRWLPFLMFAVPYIIIGYDVLWASVRNIRRGNVFDEHFLMMVATFAAFGTGEYPEACAVMLFYQVGELFQSCAVGKSRSSIAELMSIAPEFANLETPEGLEEVDPEDVEIGSIIVIRPGEKIPLDGVVIEGSSYLDTAALTGESVPRRAAEGDSVISGCINGEGTLKVRTEKAYEDSTVARILELVETASDKKSRMENFITRFARWYTPIVTIGAVLLAVIPSLITGAWSEWIGRACIFLIVSCPCALVISVPLGFFGGLGAASRSGVLVKGSNCLEMIAEADTVVLDKTGTLTRGEFTVTGVYPAPGHTEEELLDMAAHGEGLSTHPIARSVMKAYGRPLDLTRLGESEEIPGAGLCIPVDGRALLLGNIRLMEQYSVDYIPCSEAGTVIYAAADGEFLGSLLICDTVKPEAKQALDDMRAAGVRRTVMLTGDRPEAAKAAAEGLWLTEIHAGLLPADKVSRTEDMLASLPNGRRLVFVGDGINDAPVLMRADVGIAMGSLGSDAAIEAADIVIMDDDLRKIPTVVRIGRRTRRIVRQNVIFALAVKGVILVLGALGFANMWLAVFADVGVAVLAILNSMRALRVKRIK